MIVLGQGPGAVGDAFRQADADIAQARLGLFVSFTTYDAGGDLPDPVKNNGRIILLENGTFWLARAIAGAWTYPDNTPV